MKQKMQQFCFMSSCENFGEIPLNVTNQTDPSIKKGKLGHRQ